MKPELKVTVTFLDESLSELVEKGPVWATDAGGNRERADALRRDGATPDLSMFRSEFYPEGFFSSGLFEVVDLHHPGWSVIEVRGDALGAEAPEAFGLLATETEGGFELRPAEK